MTINKSTIILQPSSDGTRIRSGFLRKIISIVPWNLISLFFTDDGKNLMVCDSIAIPCNVSSFCLPQFAYVCVCVLPF